MGPSPPGANRNTISPADIAAAETAYPALDENTSYPNSCRKYHQIQRGDSASDAATRGRQ